MTNSAISDREFQTFQVESHSLDASGKWDQLEYRCRQLLKQHASQDTRRAEILRILSRSYMRQGKFREALNTSEKAIELAHQENDALCLTTMLDLRAEILCFYGDFPQALRLLALAEQYLKEGNIDNSLSMQANLAHTRAMAYKEVGWWKKAKESLRQTIEIWDYLGYRHEWSLAVAEYGRVILEQIEIEGVDEELLYKAIEELFIPRLLFFHQGNLSLAIQNLIDLFMLRTILATSEKDGNELSKIQGEFSQLRAEYEDIFLQDQKLHIHWSVGSCRNDRAWIDIAPLDSLRVRKTLHDQLKYLEGLLEKSPDVLVFWQEKAALHLCRVRHRHDWYDPQEEVRQAADCMKKAIEIFQSRSSHYTDPQIRAGILYRTNYLLEYIANIASIALDHQLPDIASRMISLAQIFRVRSQEDLLRNLETQSDRVKPLLERIRDLYRWIDIIKAAAKPQNNENENNFNRRLSEDQNEIILLKDLREDLVRILRNEISHKYQEYLGLESLKQIQEELEICKLQFEHITLQKSLQKNSHNKIKSELNYDISTLQNKLKEHQVILDYYVGANQLFVAVISKDKLQVLPLSTNEINNLHKTSREFLDDKQFSENSFFAERLQKCSQWLFPQKLVKILSKQEPEEEEEKLRLYIVVTGPLWHVPIFWLNADGKVALDRWEICLIPSANLVGEDLDLPNDFQSYYVGHPGYDKYETAQNIEDLTSGKRKFIYPLNCDYLSGVKDERAEICPLLSATELFQTQAEPHKVTTEAFPQADVIHFSCHGESDSVSPLFSHLVLEPDEQHPDGRLLLYEFLISGKLKAKIINLGACYTGKYEGSASFPESSAHVFLGIGAKYVIASLWQAINAVSVEFNCEFYNFFKEGIEKGFDPITAFNKAQLFLLKECVLEGVDDLNYDYEKLNFKNFISCANFVLLST